MKLRIDPLTGLPALVDERVTVVGRGGGVPGGTSSGSGDVVGPASATDNAIARYHLTTGKIIQNSGVTISDADVITADGLTVDGTTDARALIGSVFGYAAIAIYDDPADAQVAFAFLPVGLMSFLGYPSAGMVGGAGGASSVDTAFVRSAAGEWTAYGASGSVYGNIVTALIRKNAGSPESSVTAGVGAICHDTTNGALYIKASGTGNTGWVKVGINEVTEKVTLTVINPGISLSTGDGKQYFRIPAELNGKNLVSCAAAVTTTSSSGTPTVQIARGRQANATTAHAYADMLTTKITIDATEYDSKDATTAAVIDTSNDDVATGDLIRIDVDVAGTGTAGLLVTLGFR